MQNDINYLIDRPSGEDSFGTHTRLANSIAAAIRKQRQISVIGLLGSWGSGKSTVVCKVNEILKGDSDTEQVHSYTYDAWLHQSDPPRRAFLEELIEDLVSHSLLEGTQWAGRLAELSGRSETTETETKRGLSSSGKWIFASLSLLPLGLALFSFGLEKAFGQNPESDGQLFLLIAIVLLVSPVITGLAINVCWRPWGELRLKPNESRWCQIGRILGVLLPNFWMRRAKHYENDSIFELLANRSDETATRTTKISPDPTAIEFRGVFEDLLKELSDADRRLVITVDNLDRLAEDDALNLWATIRSLFLFKELADDAPGSRKAPIVILPIDETAIERMFKVQHPRESPDLAAAFIDKTFDITFFVTEPVMSDWREYLGQRMAEAFGKEEIEARVYWTTTLLEKRITSKPEKITPRKIIRLINSIASLLHQNRELGIDFITTAYFAINRRELSGNLQDQLGSAEQVLGGMVSDWRRQVIALYYGVHPDKAVQVYLNEGLHRALHSGDRDGFLKMMQVEGAWPVLEGVASKMPRTGPSADFDGDYLTNLCAFSAELEQRDDLRFRSIVRFLSRAWVAGFTLQALRTETADTLQVIWDARMDNASKILEAASNAFAVAIERLEFSDESRPQITQCIELYGELAGEHEGKSAKIRLDLDAKSVLQFVHGVESKVLEYVEFGITADEFGNELNNALNDEQRSMIVPLAIQKLRDLPAGMLHDQSPVKFDTIASTAFQLIQSQGFAFHATKPSLEILGQLFQKQKPARDHTTELCNNGRLNSFMQEASQAQDWEGVERIAALMLLRKGEVAAFRGKSWEQVVSSRENFTQDFWNTLKRYLGSNEAGFLLKARRFAPSFAPVIDDLLNHEECQNLSLSDVIDHIEPLHEALGREAFDQCLTKLSGEEEFWVALESIQELSTFRDTLDLVSRADGVSRIKLSEATFERLVQFEATDWQAAINDGGEAYELVQLYQELAARPRTLGDSLKGTLKDEIPCPFTLSAEARKRWFLFTRFIGKSIRATIYRNLRDKIMGGTQVDELSRLLLEAGEQFLEEGDFASASDGCARHILLPLLKTSEGQKTILALSTFFSSIQSDIEADTLATIKDTIEEISETDKEIAELLNSALRLK